MKVRSGCQTSKYTTKGEQEQKQRKRNGSPHRQGKVYPASGSGFRIVCLSLDLGRIFYAFIIHYYMDKFKIFENSEILPIKLIFTKMNPIFLRLCFG
jgi:hypothetical protein